MQVYVQSRVPLNSRVKASAVGYLWAWPQLICPSLEHRRAEVSMVNMWVLITTMELAVLPWAVVSPQAMR